MKMEAKTSEWRPGPTVCRCCLTEGCYKDISTEYFWMGKREVYAEMLADTLNLTIAYSQSGGPNSNSRLICEPCISRLRDAVEFKRQVEECEKTFLQHLDPSTSGITQDASHESILKGKQVKVEVVKLERLESDDDVFQQSRFSDDDDDDGIDDNDQPLTKLAKTPKKESVDLLDLIDNAKVAEKRKSTTKVKATPVKKAKPKKETKTSKDKPDKKKKDLDPYTIARRNAEIVVKFATAYPFRLPENAMVCVYCGESCDDPTEYRKHMDTEHQTFHVRMAFVHCNEGYVKVDCTDLRCRICLISFDTIDDVAKHLKDEHQEKVDTNYEIGVHPFILEKDRFLCAICRLKSPCIRQLSRHIQKHFLKFTCEACGKSYGTVTTLKHHITYSHTGGACICRKCKKTFNSLDARRQHLVDTPKCWSHLCNVCGERFMSWTLKQSHLAQVHGAPKRSHVCLECGETFLDRKKYREHFTISHTDDNFICTCCGQKFATKRNLEEHRVVHTKEKLFHCPVCTKSFPRKKNLVQHMWIHSEQKRFGCDLCNKQFNQRVSWKTHMKSYHPELVNFEMNKNNNVKHMLTVIKTDP